MKISFLFEQTFTPKLISCQYLKNKTSILVKEFTAAARIMHSSLNELSTLVSSKV